VQKRGRREAVEPRHVQVEHDDVGVLRHRGLDRGDAVRARAHDLERGRHREQGLEQRTGRDVVVRDHDTQRTAALPTRGGAGLDL
jgi:hypothetical protein